jgi:hypothetical protein
MLNSKIVLMIILIYGGFLSAAFAQNEQAVIKKLAKGADVILTGKVTKQNSSWNENKTRIYTTATLKVDDYLKGSNNTNTVEVTYPGGEVGDVGELYSHMPKFTNDEDVLVFLKKDKKNTGYKVFDGEEGKITLIKDSKTGEKVTTSNIKVNHLKTQIKSYLNEK